MHTATISYAHDDLELEGYVAHRSDAPDGLPVVLVAHAWGGLDAFAQGKAEALAALGYIGFAIDMYGKGRRGGTPEANRALMTPLVDDRRLLRDRIGAAVNEAKRLPCADPHRIAAIGFCFGGLCVLDLARAGLHGVRGVAAFHGLLSPPSIGPQAEMATKVLALHGFDDPMAPPEAVLAFAKEMTQAKADWQMHMYGGTMHAFTNPAASAPANGLQYDAVADRRSWAATRSFLEECFRE